jgi:hypothetical protein
MNEYRCDLWPRCGCHQNLIRFDRMLDEDRVFEAGELSTADTLLYFTLECVAHHCPDARIRMAAQRELKHPWWNEQRAGRVLDIETLERIPVQQAIRSGRA